MSRILVALLTTAFVVSPITMAIAEVAAPDPAAVNRKASPSPLVIFFALGSSKLRQEDMAILDRASRAYNEAKPLVMTVAGSTDSSGNAQKNLTLSLQRANAVFHGLLDRGIPANRFQVIGKGQTEPFVATKEGAAEAQNRRVVIAWR